MVCSSEMRERGEGERERENERGEKPEPQQSNEESGQRRLNWIEAGKQKACGEEGERTKIDKWK